MLYGAAILRTNTLSAGVGWAAVGVGGIGLVTVAAGMPNPLTIPAGVHVIPMAIGVAMLLHG
jgi:hypothetical protein